MYYNDGNDNNSLQALAGRKIRWNIHDSPQAITGILTVPYEDEFNNYEQKKEIGSIIPYVALVNSSGKINLKVYFIESGDQEYKLVNPGDVSYLSIDGNLLGNSSKNISQDFTDFAAENIISTGLTSASYGDFIVIYNKGGSTYTWRFSYFGSNNYWISSEALDSKQQPFFLSSGDLGVHLTFSPFFTLEDAENFTISVGNDEIISVDNISFDSHLNEEIGDTVIDYSFTMKLLKSGRTTLKISGIPNESRTGTTSKIFSIEVADSNGKVSEDISSTGLRPVVSLYSSAARTANGRPIYDSAAFERVNLEFKCENAGPDILYILNMKIDTNLLMTSLSK